MTLRIQGGLFRGRLLKTPKGDQTRPTQSVMRKAVFDILQDKIQEAQFLDLCAGSGAMGLEALSRGAKSSTFIESHSSSAECIEENSKILKCEDECQILVCDLLTGIKRCLKAGDSFDVIYLDPPYALTKKSDVAELVLETIDTTDLLKPGGILFIEEASPPKLKPDELSLKQLLFRNSRRFGGSILHQWMQGAE